MALTSKREVHLRKLTREQTFRHTATKTQAVRETKLQTEIYNVYDIKKMQCIITASLILFLAIELKPLTSTMFCVTLKTAF